MTNKQSKEVFGIVLELGFLLMSIMSQASLPSRFEQCVLNVLSGMRCRVAKLLELSQEDIKEVMVETKAGMAKMFNSSDETDKELDEAIATFINGHEEAQA